MKTLVSKPHKIKRFLIGAIILMVVGISFFLIKNRQTITAPEIKNIDIDSSASMKLKGIEHISKKNGVTEWALKASSAKLIKENHTAVLEDVQVRFVTKNLKEIHVKSKQGIFNTKTHDLSFSDDVVASHEDYVLETDKLQYEKKAHIIVSNTHVVIRRLGSVIEADSMVTKLKKNVTILKGNVKGKFSEKFTPF